MNEHQSAAEAKRIRNERLGLCQECGKPGKKRVDKGLAAGTHCDACWYKMVHECRRRSW
jgi:RNA polymerase-binding transcription factor DksA